LLCGHDVGLKRSTTMESVNRRRFLTRAGVVSGAAAFVGLPGLGTSGIAEHPIEEIVTPGPVSKEPVFLYVRDAARGEVTILHGPHSMTYRDRALVKRMLKAARVTAERAALEMK
jgi:hypothetical protein